MDRSLFQSYLINERSQISFVKREIHNLVKPFFGENRTGEIDIVVSEACSNLVKHATAGELLYRLTQEETIYQFEFFCIDNGPGIKDVNHSLKDGISTKNTLGQGLGSISRLSDFFQIYSLLEWGTIIYCRFHHPEIHKTKQSRLSFRTLRIAKPGEMVSGDNIALREFENKAMVFCGDGLGHGENAKLAVDQAIGIFKTTMSVDPADIIREIHEGVKKTRGLVGTISTLSFDKKHWEICGVGNILSRLQKGMEYRNYLGHNGVIGMNIPGRLENAVWQLEKFQMMVFCSDGINTRWDLSRYPSILKFDPIMIAAALYKDHARKNDDMTVMIVKIT